MKLKLRPLMAAALALSLVAASCGDSDETTLDTAAATTADGSSEMSEMDDDSHGDDSHDHSEVIEVPEGMAVPQISVSAEPDSVEGYNLFVDLEDFEITPEAASTEPVDGQGHLHLYVDGERTKRFYNEAIQVTGLSEGEHTLMVEVSANNHSAYAVDGEPIRAMADINVTNAGEGHSHDDSDETFEPETVPTLNGIEVTKDPKSGWNVFADISDFTFSPQSAGEAAVAGQGHLHLSVDGEKVARLYGQWWHIPALDEGSHTIEIEVVADDHAVYAVDGEPISASQDIDVSAEDASDADDGHSHEDGDAMEMEEEES